MLLTVLLSALGTNLIALVLVDKLLPQGQRMMRPLDLDWGCGKNCVAYSRALLQVEFCLR